MLTKLTARAETVYERFFSQERINNPLRYGLCWDYVRSTARTNPYYFIENDSLITLDFRKTEDALIVLPLGGGFDSAFPNLAVELMKRGILRCTFSKLTKSQLGALEKSYRLGRATDARIVVETSDIPDDVYPQPVISLPDLSRLEGSQYRRIRYLTRSFARNLQGHLRVIPYDQRVRFEAEEVVRKWRHDFTSRRNLPNVQDDRCRFLEEPYLALLDILDGNRNPETLCQVFSIHSEPCALSVITRTSRDCYSQLASMALTKWKGLPEYVIWRGAVSVGDRGGSYLNLGGSETKSLFRFKTKFRPRRLESSYCRLLHLREGILWKIE